MTTQDVREEPSWYAEIGQVLSANKGEVETGLYFSANEPLRVPRAEMSKLVGKLRVETRVFEDKSVTGNRAYNKKVNSKQINYSKGEPAYDSETPQPNENILTEKLGNILSDDPAERALPPSDSLRERLETEMKWTKNIIDKILDRQNLQTGGLIVLAIVAALALGRTF